MCHHEDYKVDWDMQRALEADGEKLRQIAGQEFYCTVCHTNTVDALGGFDTCADCLSRQ